jgi:hypothetical protein
MEPKSPKAVEPDEPSLFPYSDRTVTLAASDCSSRRRRRVLREMDGDPGAEADGGLGNVAAP